MPTGKPEDREPEGPGPEPRRRIRLGELVDRHVRPNLPPRVSHDRPPRPPRVAGGLHGRLLALLRVVPWLLALAFGVSFVWDFPGVEIELFGFRAALGGALRIVSVGGLIGFLTNWLAITMLFRPRARRPLVGQGLIPRQRDRVIHRLAGSIHEELINEEMIRRKIEESGVVARYRDVAFDVARRVLDDPDFRSDLKGLGREYLEEILSSPAVRGRIVDFTIRRLEGTLDEGLGGLALRAYRFLDEDDFRERVERAVADLPQAIPGVLDELDPLLDQVPDRLEAESERIESSARRLLLGFVENLDLHGIVISNMNRYDERRLEELLRRATNEQLDYIKYLGAVLGTIGGLVIWRPGPALATLAVVGLLLFLADELLFRLRRREP